MVTTRSMIGLLALAQSVGVLAAVDTSYNSSLNFRPNNVTGLWYPLYDWVGSYYNATLEFELTPTTVGSSTNDSVCTNLQGKTVTAERSSYLAITETGIWDRDPQNPVNLFLTVWPTDYDFWAEPLDANIASVSDYSILSSNPIYSWDTASNTNNFDLNLTTTATNNNTYQLSAEYTYPRMSSVLLNFTSCNPTTTTDSSSETWRMFLINQDDEGPDGFTWSYPTLEMQFDDRTANLTIEGEFMAYPYHPQGLGNGTSVSIAGTVKMVFRGVMDDDRSDILVQGDGQPTWERTVGFANASIILDVESGLILTTLFVGFFSGIFIATPPPLPFVILSKGKSKVGSSMGMAFVLHRIGILAEGTWSGGVLPREAGRLDWAGLWVYAGVFACASSFVFCLLMFWPLRMQVGVKA
ncbi:hypothetical protein BO70DRAFT_395647 [Aspergillus heteromorphus CBS 117.55]|uniref:Uncharacterized protein n=1 Tax=Aspergillus heteromorphus CBS 117.55 TaxID=1448321 RepID=A0A317WH05_9EURO|nr:uncharacterized protein BO70DRAFT_395647 [Aspergillus heteromorphus CBS 117.55]PWY84971.1 hypothetical protein BO70DRAFT_395647 [Aspergillus heteromorphus CBS 117.55]